MNDRVCNFWNLQLQLFQFSKYEIVQMYYLLRGSDIYVKNKFTVKNDLKYLVNSISFSEINEEDMYCLATHIALQLSGLEEE